MDERMLYQRSRSEFEKSQSIHKEVFQLFQNMKLDVFTNRNFIIEIKNWDILFKKWKENLSLLAFLPKGTSFSSEGWFNAYTILKKITYDKQLLQSKYFPLMIFHEIWHIINDLKWEEDYPPFSRDELIHSMNLASAIEDRKIDEAERDAHLIKLSQSERRAWYIAYTLLTSLVSKWYNVFDDLSKQDVLMFMNTSLKSYKYSSEMNRFKDITDTRLFSNK